MALFHQDSKLFVPSLYLCCGLLVLVYVNLYSVFSFFNQLFGNGFITVVPVLIPLIMLGYLATAAVGHHQRPARIDWRWLLPGIALCALALLTPDPRIGVKRIHVSEYLLLSFLVRYTMSRRLGGISLLFFSALFTAALGIHDEFLQGLHPLRTYGLRDMLVNGLSGTGGSCIWHGLQLFCTENRQSANGRRLNTVHGLYLAWLPLSVLALALPMTGYLHQHIPLWLTLPLAASVVCWCCLRKHDDSPLFHGMAAVSYVCFLFLIYPAAINVLDIAFS